MRRPPSALLAATAALVLAACNAAPGAPSQAGPSPASPLDLVARGEQLYRRGLRPDGSAILARVSGDIRVSGTQFSCVSCHQRSGMGSPEGWLVAPPVTGPKLATERAGGACPRPAYTRERFESALVDGIDPAGRALKSPMPRYELGADDLDALYAYLGTLSREVSPGVTPDELHLATVVAGDVDPAPMLEVLRLFVEEKNRNTRGETGRAERGPFHRANVNESYRRWVLHTWTLEGAPETWRAQLEARYAEQPVFALLSGMTSGSWGPVQAFCEAHELPGLLPNVDLPPDTPGYYTVYFSRGLRLEAARIALEAAGTAPPPSICQVWRADSPGEAAAATLQDELRRRQLSPATDRPLAPDAEAGELVETLRSTLGPSSWLVLWSDPSDLDALARAGVAELPGTIVISSTRLDGDLGDLPVALASRVHAAHPFRVPVDYARASRRTRLWLDRRGDGSRTDAAGRRIQVQTHFACMLAGEALMHVKHDDFFRDFVLESVDHMTVIAGFSGSHPSLTFGPGQRFLSKGCYLLGPDELLAGPAIVAGRWDVP